MNKLIHMEEARELLLSLPVHQSIEHVALEDAAGRVLAENIHAVFPMPPFTKSPYDGYALRGEETVNASQQSPAIFQIEREISAGDPAGAGLQPGTAVKIYTGAPLPTGANVTIKYELTESDGITVKIFDEIIPGTNVVSIGEDYQTGTLLAEEGARLSPSSIGVLASQGILQVPVYKKPVISIISTGSELASVGESRPEFGIYNSSYYTISGYLRKLGAEIRPPQIVRDDLHEIETLITEEMKNADMVITTGGASVGNYDFAVRAAQGIDANILFWKIKMKPGGAMLAAEKNGKLLLSLSGNPGSAVMGLLAIVLPYLRKLCGFKTVIPEEIALPLKDPLPKFSPKGRLLRGHIAVENGQAYFEENLGRGNGQLSSYEHCDLLGVVPSGSGQLPAGTMIKAYRLPYDIC